jgi:SAM-dependent methyltransferase
MPPLSEDKSNGYDALAETFMRTRNPTIGPATVLEWAETLTPGSAILELGCGHGVISQALIGAGFAVYGIDASPRLIAAFRERFPGHPAECAPVEDATFFRRTFDAIIAWGLLFLLPLPVQKTVIGKVARGLNPGGRFLFTSPRDPHTWNDGLTGLESISPGLEAYEQMLHAEGLIRTGEAFDEGENCYHFVSKPG